MKTKNLTAVLAVASLLPLAGTTFAADAHDSYHRSFYGDGASYNSTQQSDDMGNMGKAAYGSASDTSAWSAHDAYRRSFPGDGGASYSKPETNAAGKAAYGSSSSIDGLAAYRNAFHGD